MITIVITCVGFLLGVTTGFGFGYCRGHDNGRRIGELAQRERDIQMAIMLRHDD